ncbi:MAG: NIPSNAP family protein [Nocardioidaceae bacterium]
MSITHCPVVELRQYTLKPDTADTLIELFEAHFVESQEAVGMRLGGLFRQPEGTDRFVWMRGFASMETRHQALSTFYTGPVWKQHGPAANATMIDSDNVLLLRPTDPPHPPGPPGPRPPVGSVATGRACVVVTTWFHELGDGTCHWLARDVQPLLAELLGTNVATWRTEPAENTFPALPVRSDHAFVWTATFRDQAARDTALASLDVMPAWQGVRRELDKRGVVAEVLRLRPTLRSQHEPA